MAVFPMLAAWVRHREEVSDDVIYLESAVHQKQCPGNFEEDAATCAKTATACEVVAETTNHCLHHG